MIKRSFLFFLLFSQVFFSMAQTPSLVINEVSNGTAGTREYLEFLVIGPTPSLCEAPATLDLRNWIFDDNNGFFGSGSGMGIAQGAFRFKNDPFWSAIPVGTLIVVYNDGDFDPSLLQDDLSLTDGNCKLVIPCTSNLLEAQTISPMTSDPSYPASGWATPTDWAPIGLRNAGDGVLIFQPTNTTTPVHSLAYGDLNIAVADISFSGVGGQSVYSMHNTNSDDFYNVSNWKKEDASTSQTPGLPNSAANEAYILSLSNGCPLVPPTIPAITVETITDATCGNADGEIIISVSNGTAPYNYTWSNGTTIVGTSQNLTDVPAGTYTVTVTDDNNCTATNGSGTILNDLGAPTVTVETITDATCGNADGEIIISVSNGTAPYNYTWSNGTTTVGTSQNLTDVPAGTYTVTVTDGNNCTATNGSGTTLNDLGAPTVTVETTTDATCGNADGEIIISVSNGTAPYNYTWSNGTTTVGTSQNLTDVPAGTYTVTVTDGNNCTATNGFGTTLNDLGAPTVTVETTTDATCGNADGEIIISVSNGTAPYNYTWSNGTTIVGTSQNLTDVPAGTYTVTVTDDNNCTATNGSGTILNDLGAPTVTVETITDATCGNADGEIIISVSNGTAPYNYTWSNGTTTVGTSQNLTDVPAGVYGVEVQDANNCVAVVAATVEQTCDTIIPPPTDTLLLSDLEMANVFTPNGDGYNDEYIPVKQQNIVLQSFVILNRWGNIMYQNDVEIKWDGTSGGNEAVAGTYFYLVRYLDHLEEEKSLHGFFHLVR